MEKESETNAPVLTDKEQKIAEMQAKYKKVDERLIQACVVYPDRITLMALLDEYPFFEGPLVREIVTVSGGGVAKK